MVWCQKRLQVLDPSSVAITLEEWTANGTPKHPYFYIELRNFLQLEVFSVGYQLPRCNPPAGGYNWTPAITNYTSSVSTMSFIGEEALSELDS